MGSRTQSEIHAHMVEAGVDEDKSVKISLAYGLKGAAAKKIVKNNKAVIGEITRQQQISLFNIIYPDYVRRASVVDSQTVYECSKRRADDSDLELNRAYKELVDRVISAYKADPRLGDELLSRIKASQRIWIKLRDGSCSIETFIIAVDTQAFETTKNNCLARASTERAHYLKNLSF